MDQTEMPNSLRRTLKISFVLMFISAFIVIVMGNATERIHLNIKSLSKFLATAENVQPNFESSLLMYTENTKGIIEYMLSLRPGNENEYVQFISEVESIGQKLSLNVELNSVDSLKGGVDGGSIGYNVSFFGSEKDLNEFLFELEKLPYFTKIEQLNYRNVKFEDNKEEVSKNITLRLRLFIKGN